VNMPIATAVRRVVAATAVLVATAGALAAPAAASPARSPRVTAAAASPAKSPRVTAGTRTPIPPGLASRLQYKFTRLAKAQPDECFNGIGQPYPAGPPCASGQAKVNQAYVWGLTQAGTMVWFGTGANVHCLVSGYTLGYMKPVANSDWTCEYGDSQAVRNDPAIPANIGDMRPPQVWTYDTITHKSVNRSAEIAAKSPDDALRLAHTVGLRAAGTFGNVVLLGGPALEDTLNMFAFDATTKEYLGSITFPDYSNIRTFLVAQGALYLGVGTGHNGTGGGGVLRWTGDTSNPFSFVTVATLPVQAADLIVYGDQIAATTWPTSKPNTAQLLAGLWVSPKLSDGAPGLNPEDATGWKQVWNAAMYEPDRVTAATYGGGGLASYGGYVYWGTMHVPMKASIVAASIYPPADDAAAKTQRLDTQRAVSIWRGKDLGLPTQKIELLYGESTLPAWDPTTSTWSQKSTHFTPLYGKSGFGNIFNNYTWRMTVVDNRLFIGTMDWSYLFKGVLASGKDAPVNSHARKALSDPNGWAGSPVRANQFGGDLWMFPSTTAKATAINTSGLGNYLNYGIRNMIPNGSGGLYLGMANPMNLRTNPKGGRPEGGWELIEMTQRPIR
jgi:hypothetical protein